jgi:hypothetical protein
MSKLRQGNVDLLMYRMDMIEKRLDAIESLVHSKSGNPSSEILHLLLDVIKQQSGHPATHLLTSASTTMTQSPSQIKAVMHDKAGDDNLERKPGDSFDALTCMGRRRTVV